MQKKDTGVSRPREYRVISIPEGQMSALPNALVAIVALITRMGVAWNRGDFRDFMEEFANPDVIFVSRGRLRFFDIRIEMFSPDNAQLISRISSIARRIRRTASTRA